MTLEQTSLHAPPVAGHVRQKLPANTQAIAHRQAGKRCLVSNSGHKEPSRAPCSGQLALCGALTRQTDTSSLARLSQAATQKLSRERERYCYPLPPYRVLPDTIRHLARASDSRFAGKLDRSSSRKALQTTGKRHFVKQGHIEKDVAERFCEKRHERENPNFSLSITFLFSARAPGEKSSLPCVKKSGSAATLGMTTIRWQHRHWDTPKSIKKLNLPG